MNQTFLKEDENASTNQFTRDFDPSLTSLRFPSRSECWWMYQINRILCTLRFEKQGWGITVSSMTATIPLIDILRSV